MDINSNQYDYMVTKAAELGIEAAKIIDCSTVFVMNFLMMP